VLITCLICHPLSVVEVGHLTREAHKATRSLKLGGNAMQSDDLRKVMSQTTTRHWGFEWDNAKALEGLSKRWGSQLVARTTRLSFKMALSALSLIVLLQMDTCHVDEAEASSSITKATTPSPSGSLTG
jgi:hypothetical protein